jgi:putative Mg2+ transporter-C (MgtC) family protein
MHSPSDLEFVLRVLLATACGAAIGLERQYRSRTAGLRTQALVAAGAATFVLFGEQVGGTLAPLQITAYVVSGVGFLGGGVILRQGFSVQGLNTAATLWCSAAVGAQAAGGNVIPAVAFTAIVLAIHTVLRPLGRLLDRIPADKSESVAAYTLRVEVLRKHEPHVRAQILQALSVSGVRVLGVAGRTIADGSNGTPAMVLLRVHIEVEGRPDHLLDSVVSRLSLEPGLRSVSWETDGESLDEDRLDDDVSTWWRRRRRRVGHAG